MFDVNHHEIIRSFLFGRKAMTNLDSILKIKDIKSLGVSASVLPMKVSVYVTHKIKSGCSCPRRKRTGRAAVALGSSVSSPLAQCLAQAELLVWMM